MASYQYSVDLFLEESALVVIFPESEEVKLVSNYDSKGRRHEGGDFILDILNEDGIKACWCFLVAFKLTFRILPFAETEDEAISAAREYVLRVARWHGHEDGEIELNVFGQLALVKWRSGPDSGQYTPNCPVSWILEFDEDAWDRENVYGVEWRKPPRPHPSMG